ncbi:MAG TPA: ATP synthase subunit I, partial [Bryobacteraceae bacterium]
MTVSEDFYQRAVARILKFLGLLAVSGTVVAFAWKGWRAAAGFALGSALAWINFLWLKGIADSMGASEAKASARGAFILGSRYLILGGIAYVILRITNVSTPATL